MVDGVKLHITYAARPEKRRVRDIMGLTSAPKLTASMHESSLYRRMGAGLTDRIFLLAHDSSLPLNDPYPVSSMHEAVRALDGNTQSPLLLSLMEAYYSGARDIWLVAAAPLEEYEPDLDERGPAYYETYRDRLNATYDVIKYFDAAQIVVPVDAPFNSTVDFLGPLVNYCVEAFTLSGNIHLGVMGTRGTIDDATVDAMINDPRLGFDEEGIAVLGQAGKFVSVFVGDGTYHLKELPLNHTSSVAVGVAAVMSQLPLDRGMTYRKINNIINTSGDIAQANIEKLAAARLNPVSRNLRGRRGNPFEVIAFTDNTLAWDGSDFWSLVQTRLAAVVSHEVRAMGQRRLGTIGYDIFRDEVETYLAALVTDGVIRGYDLFVRRDLVDKGRVLVDIDLEPYFGLRRIHVSNKVGPAQ